MTWKQLTERVCREWKLLAINPHDRRTWRSGVFCLCCGFTAQATQWSHVEHGQFT